MRHDPARCEPTSGAIFICSCNAEQYFPIEIISIRNSPEEGIFSWRTYNKIRFKSSHTYRTDVEGQKKASVGEWGALTYATGHGYRQRQNLGYDFVLAKSVLKIYGFLGGRLEDCLPSPRTLFYLSYINSARLVTAVLQLLCSYNENSSNSL